ncbi:hypothetical protein JW899_00180 [Candidatus Uhrbacteria bacterium]|nr:hypothetical protein [Candidatus Uhrbacteria bacterium]
MEKKTEKEKRGVVGERSEDRNTVFLFLAAGLMSILVWVAFEPMAKILAKTTDPQNLALWVGVGAAVTAVAFGLLADLSSNNGEKKISGALWGMFSVTLITAMSGMFAAISYGGPNAATIMTCTFMGGAIITAVALRRKMFNHIEFFPWMAISSVQLWIMVEFMHLN